MSSVAALVQGQIQEVKARSLQTLMAVLDEMGGAGLADPAFNAKSLPRGNTQPVTVLLPPQGNKLTIAMGGMPLEVILPEALVIAARTNPGLLARGSVLMAEADPANGSIRLALPDMPNAPSPATLRTLTQTGGGPSTSTPPPLADFFPAGSPGALIQRLSGLKLPLAERADSAAIGNMPRSTGAPPASLPPPLMEAALRAALRQLPIGPALTAILSGEAVNPAIADAIRHLRLDGLLRPDGEQIATSIRNSGLFLESKLAAGLRGPVLAMADLKATLQSLKAALPPPEPALPGRVAGHGERASAATPPAELARLVEGAVERIKLQQLASLPDHPGLTVTDERGQAMRIALQIPLAPQGPDRPETAMIGLMIEHQPHPDTPRDAEIDKDGRGDAEAFPWKVRIAVDLEETGPVQAEIAMRGQRVAVTLWAERKSMAESARSAIGALHRALTGAALDVAHLDVRDGRPSGPAPRHLPMLDRRS